MSPISLCAHWVRKRSTRQHVRKPANVGKQDLPPGMSLWHVDYFKLKTIQTQKNQEEILTLPLTAKKNLDWEPVPRIQLYPDMSAKILGWVWWGKRQGLETRVLSVSHCLCRLQKHLFTEHLLFYLHSEKEPTCQCKRHRRHGFDPWVRKIPWRWAWQPTPAFLPGQSHGQRNLTGYSP